MNYDNLPSRGKVTSDGEKTKDHYKDCGGRCYVSYDENKQYHVECEKCGTVAIYASTSMDLAIKMWNDMPSLMLKIETSELELRVLWNFINRMPKTYRARNHNWCIVQDILLNGTRTSGMTSCVMKCVELGIDPYGYKLEDWSV